MSTKETPSNITNESKNTLRKAGALVTGLGISAMALVGCSSPDSAPKPVEATSASPSPENSTPAPSVEAMQESAVTASHQMAESILQTYNQTMQTDPSMANEGPAGDDGSVVQEVGTVVQTPTGIEQFTLRVQRYNPEQSATADGNLESINVTKADTSGNISYDFSASLYQDGSVYKLKSNEAGYDRAVDFSQPLTAEQASTEDQMLIRAQAVLEDAQR